MYASRSGNTRRVAEEIGRALRERGEVQLFEVADAPSVLLAADLVILGSPTEGHSVAKPMAAYLARMKRESVAGKSAAAFDTRLHWPRLLSGSAAEGIAKRLRVAGAEVVVAPESFIVNSKPELEPGELERAGNWARDVAAAVEQSTPALATR